MKKYRKRRPTKNDTNDDDHIELGKAGIDIGYDDDGTLRKRYVGKIGGDEKYFDSNNPGSEMSNNKDCMKDELP